MRHQTSEFVAKFLEKYSGFENVLDVGSLDISGSVKGSFGNIPYTGVDMREGPNVNVVVNGHELTSKFEPESFDVVVCFDTLEHDEMFWLTVEQMRKVVRKGGWMLIGVPGRRCPLHEHPGDYWRFMPSAMDVFFQGYEEYHKVVEHEPNGDTEDEIYGWGRRPL